MSCDAELQKIINFLPFFVVYPCLSLKRKLMQQPSPPDARQATPTGTIHRGHAGFATGARTYEAKGDDLDEHRQPCAGRQDTTGFRCGYVSPLAQWALGSGHLCARFEIGTVDGTVAFAIRVGQTTNGVFALTADGSACVDEVGGHGNSLNAGWT